MYKAMDIAEYIINKCTQEKQPISNLQLQKILYYLQVEFLRKKSEPLFEDVIEAWQFGPVIPNVYFQYCGFGSLPINLKYNVEIDKKDSKLIDNIVEQKRILSPWELVSDTHNPAKAWANIFYTRGNHSEIPIALIKDLDL